MGFFRRHKAKDYTLKEVKDKIFIARTNIANKRIHTVTDWRHMDKLLEEWACWRELLARKEKRKRE